MICSECGEDREKYQANICRRCTTRRLNRRSLQKIIREFKPASAYNAEIFEIFTGAFDERHLKNADLPVALRLSKYLELHPLQDLNSWTDVYKISDQAGLRYTNHQSHGCAFIRIGRRLEKLGRIESRSKSRIIQIRNQMDLFPEVLRPVMEDFYQEVIRRHKRTSSGLKVIRCVHAFFAALGNPDRFLFATEDDAKEFVTSLSRFGTSSYTEYVRSLNRFFNWAKAQGHSGENPFARVENAHVLRTCPVCGYERNFWTADDQCDDCYRHKLYKQKVDGIASSTTFPNAYNKHIFDLHLKYLNRFQIRSSHLKSTRLLSEFLKVTELKAMRSWSDVARARKAFMSFHELNASPPKGCPIEKIAYVLQELGVLPIREEDHAVFVETALAKADPKFAQLMSEYLEILKRHRRSVRSLHGVFKMVHDFYLWTKANGSPDLFTVSEELARKYILSLKNSDHTGVIRRVLDKFYRWAIDRKKTLFNPFSKIDSIYRQPALEICSNDAIKKLERFIKKSTSDPEEALTLCLIFYFGFTATDLAMANLDATTNEFRITLHRQSELTYGHKNHRRDKVFTLPTEPAWLLNLQKRYLLSWRERLAKIKRDFALTPLLLRSDFRHARPLRSLAVRDRVKAATISAVGFEIPVSVIRRTGAHVYSNQVDAAILTQFGWSKDYSFEFVWRQRKLFTARPETN